MRHSFWFIALLAMIMASSCIPNKDLVYLQKKENQADSLQYAREVQKPYRIQINDILVINVKALDQEVVQIFNPLEQNNNNQNQNNSLERAYFNGFTVDLHGNIRIPVLGEVNVLGFTVAEIEQKLEAKLLEEQFKETANIFVTVKLAGFRYTALGEVGRPGQQVLYQNTVNVLEALANAGEVNFEGNRKDVMIIRQYPQGQEIHHLDLTDIAIMESPYYYIQPNDMIYVKPLKQKSYGTGTTGLQTFLNIAAVISVAISTYLIVTNL
ncbi:MAG: polysaccharide biosynthesis/export family protein [Bacteroidota bacterium]